VAIYNLTGTVNVVVDVNGHFTDATSSLGGATFVALAPIRILDTRYGIGGFPGPIGRDSSISLQVRGQGGVRPDARAVVANLTATNPTAPGYLTAWPSDAVRPTASDLNWAAGQTVPNLVVVKLGTADGKLNLYNFQGSTDAILDAVGYYV
jgi:hypothetical protein